MPRPMFVQRDPLAIDAGELRHSVSMAHLNGAQDSFGQPINTWNPYRSTFASIRQLSGQELYQGSEFSSAAQIKIRTRWTDDNTVPGDRITWQSHTYVVQIVDNLLGRNRVLELTCLEIDGSS